MDEPRPYIARPVLEALKRQQLEWARGTGITPDTSGYCIRLDENLFQPLSAATQRDLAAGDGGELGQDGARGKVQALHSSASLACNFFDYWRGRDLAPLARALGTRSLSSLRFEEKFPTGLRGTAPNLDVVLREASGRVHAIESKFTEPFYGRRTGPAFKPSYFERGPLWKERGLPGCQALAEQIRSDGLGFELLDGPQLLKHMLGLATSERDWRLWLLWFDPGGEGGQRLRAEIGRFVERIGADAVFFSSTSYQELFERLLPLASAAHAEWCAYVGRRYFSRTASC